MTNNSKGHVMKDFLSFRDSKLPFESVAIGKFDGCHAAHIKLLQLLESNGMALSIAVSNPPYITPPQYREKILKIPCYFLSFESIRLLSSIEFLELLSMTLPNLKTIVVGYDFCLGHNKMNSALDIASLLKQINKEYIKVKILPKQSINDIPFHTSVIKEFIKHGDIKIANTMLNRFYTIIGFSIKGQGLGQKSLFPTINLQCKDFIMPKSGVYVSYSEIFNRRYKSVTFIGYRVSTDNNFCIETHILEDIPIDIDTNTQIKIRFIKRLRDNMKFDNLENLKSQIQNDIIESNKIFESNLSKQYQ